MYISTQKPSWLIDAIPADYESYKDIWDSFASTNFEFIELPVLETMDSISDQFEQESRIITPQVFEWRPNLTIEERQEMRQQRLELYQLFRQEKLPQEMWRVYKPLTSPQVAESLDLQRLIIEVTYEVPNDEWVSTTLYERVEVDEFREYPGSKLCRAYASAYVLLGPGHEGPLTTPLDVYQFEVYIDEDEIIEIVEEIYERQYDKEERYGYYLD